MVTADDESTIFYRSGSQPPEIHWTPTPRVQLKPRPDGTPAPADGCAALYHEFFHFFEDSNNTIDDSTCGSTGIPISEVRASFAENAYRRAEHPPIPERVDYHGADLPASLTECNRSSPADKGNPRIGPCHGFDGASCGTSNGDPHLWTFDQLPYDFHAVGEFVAVRAGDLEIQTRQATFPGSRVVSVNTAIAARVGPDRLGFYLDTGGGIAVHRNGAPFVPPSGQTALGGGTLVRERDPALPSDPYTLRWADGSTAWLDPIGPWGLRMTASLAGSRAGGRASGLLGDADGNNPVGRDGRRPRRDPNGRPVFDDLYPGFADHWRVTGSESLFDYPAGQDTGSYTDRTFPDRAATLDGLSPASRSAAARVCAAIGLTDRRLLDDCVLDVGLTGRPDFAVAHAGVQTALVEPPPPAAPVIRPGWVTDGQVVSGELTSAAGAPRYALNLAGAASFAVADWRGTSDACDQTFSINVVGVSGNNFPCTGGLVVFNVADRPAPVQVEIAPRNGGTGPYRFRLITIKPRQLPVSSGQLVEVPSTPAAARTATCSTRRVRHRSA